MSGLAEAEVLAFVPVGDVARASAFDEGGFGATIYGADDDGAVLSLHRTRLRPARPDDDGRPPHTVLGLHGAGDG